MRRTIRVSLELWIIYSIRRGLNYIYPKQSHREYSVGTWDSFNSFIPVHRYKLLEIGRTRRNPMETNESTYGIRMGLSDIIPYQLSHSKRRLNSA